MFTRLTSLGVLALASCGSPELTVGPGTIAGTVTLEGSQTPPPLDVLIDASGRLADVLVKLTRVQVEVPEPAEAPLVFVVENEIEKIEVGTYSETEHSRFRPHVAGIQMGREFAFDKRAAQTNPHWSTDLNETWGRTYRDSFRVSTTFQPEVTTISSDLYGPVERFPGMHAHLVIVEHPWFAVSSHDGSFTIEGVPPGTYGLEAWHATLGTRVLSDVTVSAGASARVKFIFRP
jgi:hypothetical protein